MHVSIKILLDSKKSPKIAPAGGRFIAYSVQDRAASAAARPRLDGCAAALLCDAWSGEVFCRPFKAEFVFVNLNPRASLPHSTPYGRSGLAKQGLSVAPKKKRITKNFCLLFNAK